MLSEHSSSHGGFILIGKTGRFNEEEAGRIENIASRRNELSDLYVLLQTEQRHAMSCSHNLWAVAHVSWPTGEDNRSYY